MLRESRPRFFSQERLAPATLTLVVGALTLFAVMATNGHPGWTVLPLAVAAILWLVAVSPVRNTFFVLLFFSLSTDRPGDANGLWESPFVHIGGLLSYNMSNTLGIEALKFSGIAFALLLLIAVRTHRYMMGRTADTPDAIVAPAPLRWSLAVGLMTAVGLLAWGVLNGGDSQMAKVQTQVYLPLLAMAFVLSAAFRGARDYRSLGKVVLAAACCKAVMALWARHVMPEAFPDAYGVMREVEYATSHGDSLLFACACLILLVPLFFNPSWRQLRWVLLIGPLLIAGMIANDRRLAWVELAIGLVPLPLMNPQNWFSRHLRRTLILMSPVLLLYVGVGWFSASRVFGPVKMIRSVVSSTRSDGSIDRSTLFRDVENFNLIFTFQAHPFLGSGFGHPFQAAVANDDMSAFKDYPFLPHNSLLGLMGFCGGLGVMGLFTPLIVALYFGARGQFMASSPELAAASAVAIGNIGAYLMHVWGDIGFTEPTSIFTVGAALAIAGQVAVASGAWRGSPASARTVTVAR